MWTSGLYVISAEKLHPERSLLSVMEAALKGGAGAIQLRDKESDKAALIEKGRQLQQLARRYQVPFIMNDHLDVALAINADGVHVGQGDFPLGEARALLGADKLIGISTHTKEEALEAEKLGADYIGIGPVYETSSKEDTEAELGVAGLKEIRKHVSIPTVAIGGIKLENAEAVAATGVNGLAVISEVVTSNDIEGTCRAFTDILTEARERDA
ncbi:thiamine phosphate synthase [Natribacillus halophilus]|uniref:Thiamine-phosphate synthase n=1 Tax=Natribacillus halophilus TaxID=549003 RepID=A0A1G8JMY6_9BACI|nr:thiamine phosphate synthase [Natribacillus halophilus]SDI32568.1 thiamine-phosphate diphosphorylase [Natribacillus halophilus]